MRHLSRAALALAIPVLAACGTGANLLSANEATTLKNELVSASNALSNGDCTSADHAIQQVQTQVATLPGSVDPTLVSDLSRGADTVRRLATGQCAGAVGTGANTTSTPTTATTTRARTTSTPTTTATSTSTTTTPTTPSTTSTTTTTTTPTTATTPTTPATTSPPPGTGTTTTGNGGATLPGSAAGGSGQNGQ